ncbi:MAG TPA: hypothetical protein VI958_04120 [Acidobacteriota bacterium]
MSRNPRSGLASNEYPRIRQLLKVEGRLSVRRISLFCPDLSIDQVDRLILQLERWKLIQVEREWEGFLLKKEDFYIKEFNDTSDF